jgi:hypothetical protein
MSRQKAHKAVVAVSVLLLALCLLVVYAAAKATEADLAKVKVGMERAEVLKVMGKPDRDQEVRDVENLCRLYVYKNVGRHKVVNIWFDCADKVSAVDKAG